MLDTPAVGLTGSTTAACTSLQAPPCPLRLHSQHHTRRCSLLLRGVLITPSFVMAAYNVYSFTHFHTLPRTEIPWPRRMPPSRPPPCQPLSWHGGEPGARLPALSCLGNRCDSLRRAQHPTHTASVTPIRRSNAPGKGTRRRTRAPAQLHKREPRSTRSLPSQPPSTQPRTFEVEPCERPVLLERDRQSSRAVVADLIVCGVHSTQPTHGKRHAPTRGSHVPGNGTRRTRAAQLQARVSHCIVRAPARGRRPPWNRATSLPSQPPSTEPRTSEIEPCERPVLLERDRQSSRAVGADAIPCGVHSTRPTRQASRRQGGATRPATGPDAARARPPNCTSAGLANCTSESRSALCARARPPAVGPCPTPPATEHRAAHIRGGAS